MIHTLHTHNTTAAYRSCFPFQHTSSIRIHTPCNTTTSISIHPRIHHPFTTKVLDSHHSDYYHPSNCPTSSPTNNSGHYHRHVRPTTFSFPTTINYPTTSTNHPQAPPTTEYQPPRHSSRTKRPTPSAPEAPSARGIWRDDRSPPRPDHRYTTFPAPFLLTNPTTSPLPPLSHYHRRCHDLPHHTVKLTPNPKCVRSQTISTTTSHSTNGTFTSPTQTTKTLQSTFSHSHRSTSQDELWRFTNMVSLHKQSPYIPYIKR